MEKLLTAFALIPLLTIISGSSWVRELSDEITHVQPHYQHAKQLFDQTRTEQSEAASK